MKQHTAIKKIIGKIIKEYHPEKIILYGSYAYGSPTEDSDIDLLIIKNTTERPIDRRVHVRRIVSDPQRRIPLEPLVLTDQELNKRLEIGDQFVKEILTRGRVLYET